MKGFLFRNQVLVCLIVPLVEDFAALRSGFGFLQLCFTRASSLRNGTVSSFVSAISKRNFDFGFRCWDCWVIAWIFVSMDLISASLLDCLTLIFDWIWCKFVFRLNWIELARCSKTSLKLAVSRIKLLRNKKDVHVKQLKRELAQLLENGQEQTARIRVILFYSSSLELILCVFFLLDLLMSLSLLLRPNNISEGELYCCFKIRASTWLSLLESLFPEEFVFPYLFQVEHFVREEKSKEAYELIEIFCELIVARMPMIESQKYVNLCWLKFFLLISH